VYKPLAWSSVIAQYRFQSASRFKGSFLFFI
jgi:hypothetical protein